MTKDTQTIIKFLDNKDPNYFINILGSDFNKMILLERDYWDIIRKIVAIFIFEFVQTWKVDWKDATKEDVEMYKRWMEEFLSFIKTSCEFAENITEEEKPRTRKQKKNTKTWY